MRRSSSPLDGAAFEVGPMRSRSLRRLDDPLDRRRERLASGDRRTTNLGRDTRELQYANRCWPRGTSPASGKPPLHVRRHRADRRARRDDVVKDRQRVQDKQHAPVNPRRTGNVVDDSPDRRRGAARIAVSPAAMPAKACVAAATARPRSWRRQFGSRYKSVRIRLRGPNCSRVARRVCRVNHARPAPTTWTEGPHGQTANRLFSRA